MTTERELREQEEQLNKVLEQERNPYAYKGNGLIVLGILAIILVAGYFLL